METVGTATTIPVTRRSDSKAVCDAFMARFLAFANVAHEWGADRIDVPLLPPITVLDPKLSEAAAHRIAAEAIADRLRSEGYIVDMKEGPGLYEMHTGVDFFANDGTRKPHLVKSSVSHTSNLRWSLSCQVPEHELDAIESQRNFTVDRLSDDLVSRIVTVARAQQSNKDELSITGVSVEDINVPGGDLSDDAFLGPKYANEPKRYGRDLTELQASIPDLRMRVMTLTNEKLAEQIKALPNTAWRSFFSRYHIAHFRNGTSTVDRSRLKRYNWRNWQQIPNAKNGLQLPRIRHSSVVEQKPPSEQVEPNESHDAAAAEAIIAAFEAKVEMWRTMGISQVTLLDYEGPLLDEALKERGYEVANIHSTIPVTLKSYWSAEGLRFGASQKSYFAPSQAIRRRLTVKIPNPAPLNLDWFGVIALGRTSNLQQEELDPNTTYVSSCVQDISNIAQDNLSVAGREKGIVVALGASEVSKMIEASVMKHFAGAKQLAWRIKDGKLETLRFTGGVTDIDRYYLNLDGFHGVETLPKLSIADMLIAEDIATKEIDRVFKEMNRQLLSSSFKPEEQRRYGKLARVSFHTPREEYIDIRQGAFSMGGDTELTPEMLESSLTGRIAFGLETKLADALNTIVDAAWRIRSGNVSIRKFDRTEPQSREWLVHDGFHIPK